MDVAYKFLKTVDIFTVEKLLQITPDFVKGMRSIKKRNSISIFLCIIYNSPRNCTI